jgi:serine/threonine-protein kinase
VLGECVGRGGTAAVFKATRESEPETTYALKVIWPHLTGNTETLLRFRREIDTLSNLEHPRLVRFVMSGRAEECFYYVMSYIAGGTLRGKIKAQGAHTEDQALDLIERVADPLGFMHSQGLVHRDVKPGNIFYTHDDVVLGDFGLTKRIPDRGITLEEEFIGTPLYLAPEVFQSAEFGPTVDFYSLGVCAMEMLLGHAVLDEKDSMRLIGRILNEGLPSPRELLPDASEPMTVLLECLLSRDPAERPADAAAVAEAVRVARGTG